MDAILIAGPTASGKSGLALDLAARHGGVIVNADSMQVYDGLSILTARPTADEMARVEHRLYGHVAPETAYSTGLWLEDVEAVLAGIGDRLPIFVGGTGLYFEALLGGLSPMPAVPAEIRERWRVRLAEDGAAALHAELAARDAPMAKLLDPADGQRIVRALEVLEATGRSIRNFQASRGRALVSADKVRRILLMPERPDLRERIDRRFDMMMEAGALEEARELLARKLDPALPVMKAIGVRELGAFLEGKLPLEAAVERAKAKSRQYAKRQTTWFRNRFDESWHVATRPDAVK
jgi:tRNA dimethylallyltransferase